MALSRLTFPNKMGTNQLSGADVQDQAVLRELAVDRLRGAAEKRIYEESFVAKYFPQNMLTGTSTTRIDAMGGNKGMQRVEPGKTPTTSEYKFGVSRFSIDTPVLKRARIDELYEIQSHLPVVSLIGEDQGLELAEFIDETYMIVATKAAMMTQTPFQGVTAAEGFLGGTQVELASQTAAQDPAQLFNAVRQLEMQMFKKNVRWNSDNAVMVVTPEVFFTLESNEMLVDKEIMWSNGTKLEARALKTLGLPIVRSNVFPGGKNITDHLLSNSSNNNAYDGDFSKVLGTIVTRKALQDGYAYRPKYTVHWDETDLCTYATSRVAMGVGVARPEHAGVILFQ